MARRSFVVFAVLPLLAVTAAALLTAEEQARGRPQARGADFQRLLGGLGFGPALDLSDGASDFDPCLGNGACSSGRCAPSLLAPPGPDPELPRLWEEGVDALPP
jgi:hypothetical protein